MITNNMPADIKLHMTPGGEVWEALLRPSPLGPDSVSVFREAALAHVCWPCSEGCAKPSAWCPEPRSRLFAPTQWQFCSAVAAVEPTRARQTTMEGMCRTGIPC